MLSVSSVDVSISNSKQKQINERYYMKAQYIVCNLTVLI